MKISNKKESFPVRTHGENERESDGKVFRGGYAVNIKKDLRKSLQHLNFFIWKDAFDIWSFSEITSGLRVNGSRKSRKNAVEIGIKMLNEAMVKTILRQIKKSQFKKGVDGIA